MSDRPKQIKGIFLITVFKIVLTWTFFAVFTAKGRDTGIIVYTAAAYMVLAVPTLVFIHKRNALGTRVCIILALLASLPAKAFLGIVLDLVALALSFTGPAKRFWESH
ncbi:MAG: hypothetical protein GY811_27240 [Myxococcales bacterium]|nr:hypothetical protein [Myxococcales bacterium]